MASKDSFSDALVTWLKSDRPKSLTDLVGLFGEKSFAVSLLILMATPALPIPTGGITHIFEIVAVLISFEIILGRKTIWLPNRWKKISVSGLSESRATRMIIKQLQWIERRSKPRSRGVINNELFLRITGVLILLFCAAAFLAPPFSGLDTLPSIGVVIIALSLIFEDLLMYVTGVIVGSIGVGTTLALGLVLSRSFKLLL